MYEKNHRIPVWKETSRITRSNLSWQKYSLNKMSQYHGQIDLSAQHWRKHPFLGRLFQWLIVFIVKIFLLVSNWNFPRSNLYLLPCLLEFLKTKCLFKIKIHLNNQCLNIRIQLCLLEKLRIPSLLICIYQSKILVDHEQWQSFQK